ncbi:MAG TPA: hypothetical protein VMW10_04240 [Alphaproteobacteria bacterium]|nr:hypothetical protein [Alphaproteobacteria bacterium]
MTLKKLCRPKFSPEDELRSAWYALGNGLRELIAENVEFVTLLSPTKVIDQLEGSFIDDALIKKMKQEIVEKAFTKFLNIEKKKISYDEFEKYRDRAKDELGG